MFTWDYWRIPVNGVTSITIRTEQARRAANLILPGAGARL